MPSDIAHDLFEGIVCDVLSKVLASFISDGIVTLEELNKKIQDFPYTGSDKTNKADMLYSLRIKQNAVQIWCLLRLLPVMIGELVPINDLKWEVVLKLFDVVDYVTQHCYTMSDIDIMHEVVIEFNDLYSSVFTDVNIKPKQHYTTLYADQPILFGLLINCMT